MEPFCVKIRPTVVLKRLVVLSSRGLDYNSSFEFVSSSDDLPDELPTMLYVAISCMLLHDAVGRWSAR